MTAADPTPGLAEHPGLALLAALVMHPADLDVDADPLDTFDMLASLLNPAARAALASACDFCPVHECDAAICAADEEPGCDAGRAVVHAEDCDLGEDCSCGATA